MVRKHQEPRLRNTGDNIVRDVEVHGITPMSQIDRMKTELIRAEDDIEREIILKQIRSAIPQAEKFRQFVQQQMKNAKESSGIQYEKFLKHYYEDHLIHEGKKNKS